MQLFRILLIAAIGIAGIQLGGAEEKPQEFNRAASAAKYRDWLKQFDNDLAHYFNERNSRELNDADIAHFFCNSVVPNSRAMANLKDLFLSGKPRATVSGEIVFVGPQRVLQRMLNSSIPAGYGGRFPEPTGSKFAAGMAVWYMHIQGGDALERYFDSPSNFDHYHLPPNGVLERRAYPFLLFEEEGRQIRWGGIGQEFWGAVESMYSTQFF